MAVQCCLCRAFQCGRGCWTRPVLRIGTTTPKACARDTEAQFHDSLKSQILDLVAKPEESAQWQAPQFSWFSLKSAVRMDGLNSFFVAATQTSSSPVPSALNSAGCALLAEARSPETPHMAVPSAGRASCSRRLSSTCAFKPSLGAPPVNIDRTP